MAHPLKSSLIEKWLLQKLGDHVAPARIRVQLATGGEAGFTSGAPVATVVIQDGRTLARLLFNPDVEFGEAYTDGRVQIHGGNLPSIFESVYRSVRRTGLRALYSRLLSRRLDRMYDNSLRGSRSNIHRHYDLSVDFYKLWLDSNLVYTCAYFPDPSATLEDAQIAKMNHVCRKLCLRPGETVVEAGCGWGSLALHMARDFGVHVKAFNISAEQIAYARRQAQLAGLEDRIEFIEDDYRNVSGEYDAFVSVGMLEHVGRDHYPELSRVIGRCLKDTGRGFLHFIGRNQPQPLNAWIRKRIFPGGYTPTLVEALAMLEPLNVSVLDVEDIRIHYAWTLEHWLSRFEKSADRIADMYSPEFVRLWRFYLAGSLAAFRAGTMHLFQVLFARSECRSIPATRDHLYKTAPRKDLKWMTATR
ncbi:MAG TPA: cyclopropane-fatty-acyl-phospholipid synthase family protein [Candidatus Limnocylindrales bacterium]|nr:cyclopropane-fatty-acyl-phospholipid synthase family protein [Candidatus Limnocylindrales bacterium]